MRNMAYGQSARGVSLMDLVWTSSAETPDLSSSVNDSSSCINRKD